jgi:predicted  nucleic acid-binding Zn-ribbon protein
MSTNKKRDDLKRLSDQNDSDYHSLANLLLLQRKDLDETEQLKFEVLRDMRRLAEQIKRIKETQAEVQSRIDYRREVALDKQITNYQNTLHVKFKELNQLVWQLGEPLYHPSLLKSHLNGALEQIAVFEVERNLQLVFAGYTIKNEKKSISLEQLQLQCLKAATLVKKLGGVSRFNNYLNLSDSQCKDLLDSAYDQLIAEDQKTVESKGVASEDKREPRARIEKIKTAFQAIGRSFTKLTHDVRPKDYDERLRNCTQKSIEEMKESLFEHLLLCVNDEPLDDDRICHQFSNSLVINPQGFLQVFKEKEERLEDLRLRMDKVEELQSRELNTEETKLSEKLGIQDSICQQLEPRYLKMFEQISAARDHSGVSYVKRSRLNLHESFCSGCKVVVSKSLNQRVRRMQELQRCQSCRRILVPFAHIAYVKEEIDSLLVTEEERVAMEERGEIGLIPACSNCGGELYDDKDRKTEIKVNADLSTHCPHCYSYLVPLSFAKDKVLPIKEEA